MTTNPYTLKILGIITPLIGQAIAMGTIKASTTKLGINENTISTEHLPQLAAHIEKGLSIFLGSDGAKKVADQIRAIR